MKQRCVRRKIMKQSLRSNKYKGIFSNDDVLSEENVMRIKRSLVKWLPDFYERSKKAVEDLPDDFSGVFAGKVE